MSAGGPIGVGVKGSGSAAARGGKRSRGPMWLVLAACVATIIYLLAFAPVHIAAMQAHRGDGEQPLDLGNGVVVVPADEWIEQPVVGTLFSLGPVPLVRDMSVIFGGGDEVAILSPDRALRVETEVAGEGNDPVALVRETAADSGADPEAEVRTETLASGLTLHHIDEEQRITAVVETSAGPVIVRAESVGGPIDVYRPALSSLLESVSVS
ncbi:MAG: hypothetical protein ACK5LO_03165 [Leucobacter sp.]